MCGQGDWLVKKHGVSPRSHWIKLHLVVDVVSHEILDHSVTLENVSGSSEYCG
ncbi:MAG: hypothetical protein ACTSU2_05395 [Promethearchaeota archaeon]